MAATLQLRLPDTSTPSIVNQTPWECAYYHFPPRFKVQYFNPGLVDWQGNRWLVVRRRRCAFAYAKNDITLWRLAPNNTVLSEHELKIPTLRADEHWEDPRAVMFGGKLWVSYSNFYTRCQWVHQAIVRVNEQMQAATIFHPQFGGNGQTISTNTAHEKNWLWFAPQNPEEHNGSPLMIYGAYPHTVVRFGEKPKVWTGKGFRWSKGTVRGGTPPVFIDGLYWTFFHSSIELGPTPPRRRYFMGAYAFDPEAPFRILWRTSKPLLIGSDKDPRDMGAPLCVFPCGALIDNGMWHVTLGVNDCACAWIKIPHKELESLTVKVR